MDKNIPEIRFNGYDGEWEQRKLSECAEFSKGSCYSKGDLCAIGTPIILYGRLYTKYETTIKEVDTFVIPKDGSVYSKGGEVIVPASGETAEDIARAATVENAGILLGGDLNVVTPDKDINSAFLALSISNCGAQKELAKKAQGKSVVHIHNEEIKGLDIAFPKREEQDRISAYFENLDYLITLHQQKYDKLVATKKSMLDKMFPKKGCNVPEIRFGGFDKPWKESRLEDYLEVSNEKNTDNAYTKQDVLSVSGDYGIVNQIEFQGRSFAGASVENYGIVYTGDIVYTKSPLKVNPYGIIKTNKGKTGIVSTLYAIYHPRENTFSEFVQVYFEQHARMNSYMYPLVNKGAKNDMKVSSENALKGFVIFPEYEEQKIIAEFFKRLDCFIDLQQQELEKLRNIKKSLLDKMFV